MARDVLDTPEAGGLVVRGAALRAGGFAAGTLLSLAGVVLVTRHLGVELYGKYQTVVSLITVVGSITDMGMAALGLREWVQRDDSARLRLMRTLLGMRIALTTLGIAVACAIAAVRGYEAELVAGAALMGFGVLLLVWQTTLAIPLQAELRLGTVTVIELVRQGLTALALAVLVLAGAGVLPLLAAAIPVHLLLVLWTARLVRGRMPLRPRVDIAEWLALARTAVAFALALTVGTVYLYVAQVLSAFVATEEQTGLFAASFRVFIVVAAIPGILVSSAFPLLSRAARDDRARLANALQGMFEGMLILGGAAALAAVLGAEAIIAIVGGAEFADAADVLAIQGAALLATFVAASAGFALLSLHRHRAMILTNAASLAVTVALVLVLAPGSLGARGAAIATIAGELVLVVGYMAGLGSELRPRWSRAARIALAIGAGLASGLAADSLWGVPAVPAATLGLSIYGLALVVGRGLPPDVIALVPRRGGR